MDAHGVEKAVLLCRVNQTEGRSLSFAEARPDRFALGVGGFDLLKPMPSLRALQAFVDNHPVAYASIGPSFWGDGMCPSGSAWPFSSTSRSRSSSVVPGGAIARVVFSPRTGPSVRLLTSTPECPSSFAIVRARLDSAAFDAAYAP